VSIDRSRNENEKSSQNNLPSHIKIQGQYFGEVEYNKKNSTSCYRSRRDVVVKFFLRRFKNYFINDFINVTGYNRKNKISDKRRETLQTCAVQYTKIKGYAQLSQEFPFYLGKVAHLLTAI
jgi:hypothetical protein